MTGLPELCLLLPVRLMSTIPDRENSAILGLCLSAITLCTIQLFADDLASPEEPHLIVLGAALMRIPQLGPSLSPASNN